MQILANYNYRQNPNFKSLKLINERPYSKFPSRIAERVSKSSEIKGLAASLHKSGEDLAVVYSSTAEILVIDTKGKNYTNLEEDMTQLLTPSEEVVPPVPQGLLEIICQVKRHIFESLRLSRLDRQNEEVLSRAVKEIDTFNKSLGD